LLYTADNRLDHLLALIDSTGATGVIFLGEKFCEYEYFEFPFIEKQLKERGINVLALETSIDAVDSIAPVQNRIDAFAELFQ
jgi:benzoyl-CoA reductase/2-hydroxyglutaryl-CoA dehydratase subunit BcrC/BadD/HgdB